MIAGLSKRMASFLVRNQVIKIEDEEVYIEFGSSISPCLIKSVENNDYVYMILPIRLKED